MSDHLLRPFILVLLTTTCITIIDANEKTLTFATITDQPVVVTSPPEVVDTFTWWLPKGADAYILPITAGIHVDASDTTTMKYLTKRSPWNLKELPVLGARYNAQTLVVIIPWPHYAKLVIEDRVGIQFSFPPGDKYKTPTDIVVQWTGNDPLAAAYAFRKWRQDGKDLGGLPPPRPLSQKARDLPKVKQMFGAAHFYLWGPSMFSRHDVPQQKWVPLARTLRDAPEGSFEARLRSLFSDQERKALNALAKAERPMKYLVLPLAKAFEQALINRALLGLPEDASIHTVVNKNREAIATNLSAFVHDPETWGDGLSTPLLNEMHQAGIDRAVLLLNNLHGTTVRPEVVQHATRLGYFLGPYDSYHSVHSPDAHPDQTWETAQFDHEAYEAGRVVKAEGRQQGGFKGRGFHFSPTAAWPYVQQRVGNIMQNNGYSSWFIDCDATGECFDDFSPLHPANRVDDIHERRKRLRWLEKDHHLLVGSEGGSILFADVIHFGHGVHTPYIGHLDPGFRDKQSPHYLGRHWPSDSPEKSFMPVPVPPSLRSPYFNPQLRIPLYQAALGGEVVASHHWSFDSLKFNDLETVRALMEILYMVPPMYHLNREMWPQRRDKILQHVGFWSPLHRELAPASLINFEHISENRLVQRTTFQSTNKKVTITVNFSDRENMNYPPYSATVNGFTASTQVYHLK